MERLPKPTPAWVLSFPQPRSHPPNISTDRLHELVATKAPAVDFIIVDVRRTDVRTIQDPWCCIASYNAHFPITTGRNPWCHLYPLLPTLTTLLEKIPIVVFHCSSSLGRASRCAGWLQDALPPDSNCKVFILEGGIKAWRARFGEDERMVVGMPLEEVEGTGTGSG